MLAWWTQILPVFLFKAIAHWLCERCDLGHVVYCAARPDILVRDNKAFESRRYEKRIDEIATYLVKHGPADLDVVYPGASDGVLRAAFAESVRRLREAK